MKSPTKLKWWAEGSMAKLQSSLWNSFPELTGSSPWPLATENYLQKQYVKISNWSQIHLKDKQPIKETEGWTGHSHEVNKHRGQRTLQWAVWSLGVSSYWTQRVLRPGLAFFLWITALIRTSLAAPDGHIEPSEQNPRAEFKNIFILFKTW